jgi:hypothetical protein
VALWKFLISYPAAGLSPIGPERNSNETSLGNLADGIVCTQYGDLIPVSPRIVALGFVPHALKGFGNGPAVLWTICIHIAVSGNDDCRLASCERDHALNGHLRLPLVDIAGTQQGVEGLVQTWNFLQPPPLQVEIRSWEEPYCSL